MESGIPNLTEIDGIDLSNYVRDPNSYNPIVYIHKRNLKRCMTDSEDIRAPEMQNKGQQFDFEDENQDTYHINIINDNQDPTTERTIHFAKTLIPITIPPKPDDGNVYYTIKSNKKSRTENRGCKCNLDRIHHEPVNTSKNGKGKSKKPATKVQYLKTETITQSSENTNTDDTQNQTLSELSESIENKLKESPKISNDTKFITSHSFDALAEEYQDVGRIKIQIMNDKEKQKLYENICIPLINAVKENISTDEFKKDIVAIKNKIDNFSHKLDGVLERLNKIEEKLSNGIVNKRFKVDNVPTNISTKKEENTAEREERSETNRSSVRQGRNVKKRQDRDDISVQSIEKDCEGKGERVPESLDESTSFVGIAPTPVHRLPARFCWTDTKLN